MKLIHLLLSSTLAFTCLVHSQSTYTVGTTEYYYNQTYSTTGKQKVKRSEANKKDFLNSKGYDRTPYGYEIDHIIPISQGGTDDPSNMQLLTIGQHKEKTARERSRTITYGNSTLRYSNYSNTTKAPSYYSTSSNTKTRTIYTGPNGGNYYYNSKGNKTYVKKSITATYSTPKYKPTSLSSTPSYNSVISRTLRTGSRGGRYYINSNGNKTYVKKN
ncbi:HNH endonuclease signature motif containing protein [Kriegella aquimaris]|uniref:PBCV-specific basic adaptor domain-containing protein n=1 Tax=Kriegella aquimaris TaxID=192904 RepID=A0A1G9SKY8_9FLAO|nr:HNH endonuclease signature motif containing protein [Kriegella aquimaris]SDM35940.1 PBCV-specific basic adaptor domain-containing protein [Kriegella aquimaris]